MRNIRPDLGLHVFSGVLALTCAISALALDIWLHESRPSLSMEKGNAGHEVHDQAAPASEFSGMSESVRAIHVDDHKEPNLQHSLRLLRTSRSAENPVRILFYGQSITEQGWWTQVVDYLRHQYPEASLTIENRAIGGHPSDKLVKTAEADLYPFQPDLVIFHVYGPHRKYEEIIRKIAQQTTADILMATDHITRDEELKEDTDRNRLWLRSWIYRTKVIGTTADRDGNWEAWINYDFLPGIAAKYHAQLADVRDRWKEYLVENRLKASQLLRDKVHLNQRGQDLMAAIIDSYLRPAAFQDIPDDDRLVDRGLPSGIDAAAPTLKIPFRGTRIEVSPATGSAPDVSFLVDGETPCKLPGSYEFSRASPYPGSNWPALLRVQKGKTPPIAELWTIKLSNPNGDLTEFTFKLTGSVTGEDGVGDSRTRFVSTSGRIVIEPEDWNLAYAKSVIKTQIPDDFAVTFSLECKGSDTVRFPPGHSAAPILVIQGLSNGPHVIELPTAARRGIKAFRIYQPLFGRLP